MSQSRPKPWEVSSGTSSAGKQKFGIGDLSTESTNTMTVASGQQSQISSSTPTTIHDSNASTSSSVPELPSKPTSLSGDGATNLSSTSSYSPYGSTTSAGYGGAYGSTGFGTGYGSSYGGYGGYGSSYGLGGGYGMGGYGSRYGMGATGYGMGMGGMNGGAGGGMFGNSALSQNTEATFQLIESIIGAVGGFAQMLEATYMATHSSFFTMISVAEQFGHLKNALGSLLGIFTLITWCKKLLAKATGNRDYLKLNAKEFKKFEHKMALKNAPTAKQKGNRISLKPLLLFVAAIFGFPYLLKKLISHLSLIQQQQHQQQQRLPQQLDPTSLEFARALYDFNPEDRAVELELKKNDLVAILNKLDPVSGQESKWWKCRSRDGRIGFVPYNFLQIIKRDTKKIEPNVEMKNSMVEEFKNNSNE